MRVIQLNIRAGNFLSFKSLSPVETPRVTCSPVTFVIMQQQVHLR